MCYSKCSASSLLNLFYQCAWSKGVGGLPKDSISGSVSDSSLAASRVDPNSVGNTADWGSCLTNTQYVAVGLQSRACCRSSFNTLVTQHSRACQGDPGMPMPLRCTNRRTHRRTLASALTFLASADLLEMLRLVGTEIMVPDAVRRDKTTRTS